VPSPLELNFGLPFLLKAPPAVHIRAIASFDGAAKLVQIKAGNGRGVAHLLNGAPGGRHVSEPSGRHVCNMHDLRLGRRHALGTSGQERYGRQHTAEKTH